MKDKLQTAVIILLSLSAILLFALTSIDGTNLFSVVTADRSSEQDPENIGPLMPVSAVFNDGTQTTLIRETRLLTPYFDALRPILVELLGSADTPVSISTAEWCALLGGKSVLLDYGTVLPLAVIGGSAENRLAQLSADALLIALNGESAQLCLYADGVCYATPTALRSADLEALLLQREGEEVTYAYTLGAAASRLTPHSAVPLSAVGASSLQRTPLCDSTGVYERERQAMILEAFGFDSYTARSYADASWGRVFLTDLGTLRTGGDGSIRFVFEAESTARTLGDPTHCAGLAARILNDCLYGLTAVPRYVLSAVETDGIYTTASFDAYVDGAVLLSQNGSRTAARFVFAGEHLIQAELALFTVSFTEATAQPPLSPQVLLAGLVGNGTGGRLSAVYLEADERWNAAFCVLPTLRGGNGANQHG